MSVVTLFTKTFTIFCYFVYKNIHNILCFLTFILTYIVINITLTFPEVNKHAQVLTLAHTLTN